MTQKIMRIMGISSLSDGYEAVVYKEFEGGKHKTKRYRIHSASMKRFFRLSNSSQIISKVKVAPWYYFRKVRHS